MPSLTVCLFEDKVRSAPKTGPIHGVNPKAKVKPRIKFLKLLNGLGISIVSTSKGVMTDNEARKQNIGGEIICKVF